MSVSTISGQVPDPNNRQRSITSIGTTSPHENSFNPIAKSHLVNNRILSTPGHLSQGRDSMQRNTPSVSNLLNVTPRNSNVRESTDESSYYTTSTNQSRTVSSTTDRDQTVSRHSSSCAENMRLDSPSASFADVSVVAAASGSPRNDSTSTGSRLNFRVPDYRGDIAVSEVSAGYNCNNNHTNTSPLTERRDSLDSLLNAARTVEADRSSGIYFTTSGSKDAVVKGNMKYQTKVASLLELKRAIFEEIKHWPLTQNNQDITSSEYTPLLIDSIALPSLQRLSRNIKELRSIVKDLLLWKEKREIELSKNKTGVTHSQNPVSPKQRHVTLPPVHKLTSIQNSRNPSSNGFRFPVSDGTSSGSQHILPSPITTGPNTLGSKNAVIYNPPRGTFSINVKNPQRSHKTSFSDTAVPLLGTSPTSIGSIITRASVPLINKINKPKKLSKKNSSTHIKKRNFSNDDIPVLLQKRNSNPFMECLHCAQKDTPEWRRGPYGNRTLCNACGLFYGKLMKKFGLKEANTLMHYRRCTFPEDRRVPQTAEVPESFIKELKNNAALNETFSVSHEANKRMWS